MIDFIFKRKPIHLDCFTASSAVYTYAPIAKANRFVPDWWKALPREEQIQMGDQPNMRTCTGFIDLYGKGLMLPLWSDLMVDFDGANYRFQYADQTSTLGQHNPTQAGTFIDGSETRHLKLQSPWLFFCDEDISWHFSQPVWNHLAAKDYCIPPGVVSYKNMHATEINILFRKQVTKVRLVHGTPLVHIVPISERPLKISNHLVDANEYERRRLLSQAISFKGSHTKRVKIMQGKESKCPFGFGGKA